MPVIPGAPPANDPQGLLRTAPLTSHQASQMEVLLNYGTFEFDQISGFLSCSHGIHHIMHGKDAPVRATEDDSFLFSHLSETEQNQLWSILRRQAEDGEHFEQQLTISDAYGHPAKSILIRGVYTSAGDGPKVAGMMLTGSAQRQMDEDTRRHILELERSNNDLEGFAYVASHDLQEPLRKIVTFADMLLSRQNSFGEKERDYLVRIHKSAYDMRALIENLLDYSHIGLTAAAATEVPMNVILKQSLSDLEVKINAVNPIIEIGPLPELCVDPERMRRVFTNLVGNALKFGKKDVPLQIRIFASEAGADEMRRFLPGVQGKYARITIEDNGIGFEKEYEQRIFQIFQRLHGRSSYPGSGLGLAICRKIIEQHQGFIYAEGEKGRGARFHILLPLADC